MKAKAKSNNAIAALAERLLSVKLTKHQRRILQAVMRSRRVAVASCHGIGKSYALAVLALTFALMYEDARVLIITPGWLMNRAVIWSEIDAILERARHKLPIASRTQTELRLGPRNFIIGLSTADPGRLQGHHSENLLVIIDEVAAIDPNYFPAVEGLLAAGNAKLIISGNPTVPSGPFYDAFGRHRANWECIQIGVRYG
jgi:phage terminase large subunit